MQLTGAEIIVECLKEQGVDTVFGYPGGAILNVYDALYEYKDQITHVLTSHEQGASHTWIPYQWWQSHVTWEPRFSERILSRRLILQEL